MASVTLKCTLITPMFMSGADQKKQELRVPSLKGVIMFWWRAIHSEPNPQKLRDKEVEIFGGMDSKNQTYRSNVRIQIDYEQGDWNRYIRQDFRREYGLPNQNHPLLYLLYGVDRRPFLKPGFCFKVTIKSKDESKLNSAIQAFQLVSVYGGIGAKSRNGYGNFTIENQVVDIENILKSPNDRMNYTALSQGLELFETPRKDFVSALNALEELSSAYKESKSILRKNEKEYIAYSGKNYKMKNRFDISRHAKTHFLSVQPTENGFKGSILFLPYFFLSKDSGDDIIQEYQDAIKIFNADLISDENPNKLEKIL